MNETKTLSGNTKLYQMYKGQPMLYRTVRGNFSFNRGMKQNGFKLLYSTGISETSNRQLVFNAVDEDGVDPISLIEGHYSDLLEIFQPAGILELVAWFFKDGTISPDDMYRLVGFICERGEIK